MRYLHERLSGLGVGLIVIVGLTATAMAQTAAPGAESSSSAESAKALTISYSKIFTFFVVMLGPIKLLGPFVKITKGMDDATSRRLALKGFVIACLAGLAAALVGQNILFKWGVSLPALLLAGGLILLLIALKGVLSQYEPRATPSAETEEPEATTLRKGPGILAFGISKHHHTVWNGRTDSDAWCFGQIARFKHFGNFSIGNDS